MCSYVFETHNTNPRLHVRPNTRQPQTRQIHQTPINTPYKRPQTGVLLLGRENKASGIKTEQFLQKERQTAGKWSNWLAQLTQYILFFGWDCFTSNRSLVTCVLYTVAHPLSFFNWLTDWLTLSSHQSIFLCITHIIATRLFYIGIIANADLDAREAQISRLPVEIVFSEQDANVTRIVKFSELQVSVYVCVCVP